MGIKGLMKMIKHYAPNAVSDKSYSSISGSVLAMDILLVMYSFIIAFRNKGEDMRTYDGRMTSHIYGILCKIQHMLRYGVIPVAVFDGKAPAIKSNTLQDRTKRKKNAINKYKEIDETQNSESNSTTSESNSESSSTEAEKIKFYKRSFNISEKHIRDAKKLLDLMGFINFQAPGEADSQCAALNKSQFVDAVLTEDMDVLAFGTERMIRKFHNKSMLTEINLKMVLKEMKLNMDQFLDICIILGNDYCKSIKGLNVHTLYELYNKHKDMYEFINELKEINNKLISEGKDIKYKIPKNFITRWKIAKEYYTSAKVVDPYGFINKNSSIKQKKSVYWRMPDKEGLIKFLCDEHDFSTEYVTGIVKYIMTRYNTYITNGYLCTDWDTINKYNKNKKIDI